MIKKILNWFIRKFDKTSQFKNPETFQLGRDWICVIDLSEEKPLVRVFIIKEILDEGKRLKGIVPAFMDDTKIFEVFLYKNNYYFEHQKDLIKDLKSLAL